MLNSRRFLRLRSLVIMICVTIYCFIFIQNTLKSNIRKAERDENNFISWLNHLCPRYHFSEEPPCKLPKQTPVEGSIFFAQTSCRTHFKAREACAIESASYHHPHRNIQVFMTAPAIDDSHPFMKVLIDINNVKLSWMDLDEFLQDQYLVEWHNERLWFYNEFHAPRFLSDAVRVVLLWRYGGTYIDLDAITLRPLPRVTNFVGRLNEGQITHAIANFTKGHKLIDMLRKDFLSNFNFYRTTSIGPALLTNCLHKYCPGSLLHSEFDGDLEFCEDVTIFPPRFFYPIPFTRKPAVGMFESGFGYGPKFFQSTEAYSLHIYDSLTFLLKTKLTGDSILSEAARRNCPRVYDAALRYQLEL